MSLLIVVVSVFSPFLLKAFGVAIGSRLYPPASEDIIDRVGGYKCLAVLATGYLVTFPVAGIGNNPRMLAFSNIVYPHAAQITMTCG